MEQELFRVAQGRGHSKDVGGSKGSKPGFLAPSSEQSLGPLWSPTTLTPSEGKDKQTLPFPTTSPKTQR